MKKRSILIVLFTVLLVVASLFPLPSSLYHFASLFPLPSSIYQSALAAEINWKPTNQATINWDAVTTFADDTPLPADTTVQYDMWTRKDGEDMVLAVRSITVTTPTATLTFAAEGRYFVGVQAIRLQAGTIITDSNSTISWSDNPADTQGGVPFGISYYKKLHGAGGMR